jgi:hypothetical protein
MSVAWLVGKCKIAAMLLGVVVGLLAGLAAGLVAAKAASRLLIIVASAAYALLLIRGLLVLLVEVRES